MQFPLFLRGWEVSSWHYWLTHWGQVTLLCVGNLTIIGSDNGLSPGRRQAIFWTNVGILLTGPLGTNFNEISIAIQTFSFKKMHLKVSSAKWLQWVKIMVGHQTSDYLNHYLNQWGFTFVAPHSVTRPQWVNNTWCHEPMSCINSININLSTMHLNYCYELNSLAKLSKRSRL